MRMVSHQLERIEEKSSKVSKKGPPKYHLYGGKTDGNEQAIYGQDYDLG